MKILNRIIIVCSVLGFTILNGQLFTDAETEQGAAYLENQEEVFVHYNTSLLFAGESLLYNVHSLVKGTNLPSSLSKLAYVELVGEDGRILFRHKILLTNGRGQGDFFVPADTPSGNYKLLGYTKWMLNSGITTFFQGDVGIVNPYHSNQDTLLEGKAEVVQDSIGATSESPTSREEIRMTFDQTAYRRRQGITLSLEAMDKAVLGGNYSISVRKRDSLRRPLMPTARNHIFRQKSNSAQLSRQKFLPELRGQLISGRIVPKNGNSLFKEEKIGLSIPDKKFVLKMTRTNDKGEFYFNLNQAYESESGFLQVVGERAENYGIEIEEEAIFNYDQLKFGKLRITPQMKEIILKRNIYNQVENAFVEVKLDNKINSNSFTPVYREFSQTYQLNDFTRFPTIKETMLEIVDNAWVERNADGEEQLKVRENDYNTGTDLLPLILIDGVMVQNHTQVIAYDARKVEKIKLSRKECVINSVVYKGIISIETKEGDFFKKHLGNTVKTIMLDPPKAKKEYFHPRYDGQGDPKMEQIPDFRLQLLWVPQLDFKTKNLDLELFASDVPGIYDVRLEGFTSLGTPISINSSILVN